MTFVLYALFVAAQFAIRGKKSHLYDLLQFPLSLVFSRVLNLFDAFIPITVQTTVFLPISCCWCWPFCVPAWGCP